MNKKKAVIMFEKIPLEVQAFAMAAIVSFLRIVYSRKETSKMRWFLEGLICGFLSYGVASAIMALELNSGFAIFSGSLIGFFGTKSVESFATKYINKKVS